MPAICIEVPLLIDIRFEIVPNEPILSSVNCKRSVPYRGMGVVATVETFDEDRQRLGSTREQHVTGKEVGNGNLLSCTGRRESRSERGLRGLHGQTSQLTTSRYYPPRIHPARRINDASLFLWRMGANTL